MKKWIFIVVGVILISLVVGFYGLKFPLSSTDLDYISRKFGNLTKIPFSFREGKKDLRGNIFFEEVSYLPEFYGKGVVINSDNLFLFLENKTNFLRGYISSNSINFQDISSVIGKLGFSEDEMFDIITNVIDKYLNKVSVQSFSNLLVGGSVKNKDVFYQHSEIFTREWLDLSVKISRLELGVSRDVDKVKKEMEELFYGFRSQVYSMYIDDYSKGYTKVSSEVFVEILEKEISRLRDEFLKYLSKVDEVYSRLSYLKEGYKTAWDTRVEMLKRAPDRYIERYISDFPVYLIRKLIDYNFLGIPKILVFRDGYYELGYYDDRITVKGRANLFEGGKVEFEGIFSNSLVVGYVNFRDLNNKMLRNVSVEFIGNLIGDSLNGEYECKVDVGRNRKEFILSILSNDSFIDEILRNLTSEEGFVSVFVVQEGDNLFRSYKEQYERYKAGILRDINRLKEDFRKELEKSKQKLRKSYLR